MGVADHEVNAFQRVADVAIQKSIREGFGLVVSETLWKGTAMVAGRAGGIPVQLQDGIGGYLAESVEEFAARTTELLEDPLRAGGDGRRGGRGGSRAVPAATAATRPSRRLAGAGRVRSGEILVANAGSMSLKLHLVDASERSERIEDIESVDPDRLAAVAHRVVHGGPRFRDPVLIDATVHEQIFATEPLAPLHNAPCLAAIDRARAALPGVPEVAVFDTGFHATIPPEAAVYPVPRRWREEWGVRRYGFHGLSVAWSTQRAPELLGRPAEGLRLVVCHLGGGCSVSAVRDGRSVDNTMGFSPLEGVPMATRSGSVDPGALVYLMRERGLDGEGLERALNFDSGLRGLAGGSGDMREIERRRGARRGATRARDRGLRAPGGRRGCRPWPAPPVASTRSSSPPASARPPPRLASGSASGWPSSVSIWTRTETPSPRRTATSPPTSQRCGRW